VLDAWEQKLPHFVKVMPKDYQRMLACIARIHEQGHTGEEAIMAAFEENAATSRASAATDRRKAEGLKS